MFILSVNPKTDQRRWLMWAVLALSFAIVYIHRVAPSVVADHLMESFAVKEGVTLGSLAAMYFYVYLLMQAPAGLLADSLGPRATVTGGMILAGLGSLAFAGAPTLAVAFVGRFLVGLGVSVVFVSTLKFQSDWFLPREFAFITGMTVLVGNAGAVLAATPLALLVNLYGWRPSFTIVGIFSLFVSLACWITVRDTPTQAVRSHGQGNFLSRLALNFRQMGLVLKNPHSWPPFFVIMGVYGTIIAFSGIWGVPYLMQVYGLARTSAANLMLLIALGMMAGSPVIGHFSDRLRLRKAPYLAGVCLYTACWVLIVFWNMGRPPVQALYPLFFSMGFFGSIVSLTFAVAKEVNPPQVAGVAVATVNGGAFLGISVLQPLMGYLLDLRWDGVVNEGVKIYSQQAYYQALRFCLYPLLLSFIAALLVRETRGDNCYPKGGKTDV